MENNQMYTLVFGVSVFDICGFTDSNYRCNDSNPGKVRTSFGGVCRNIAECMSRVGVNTQFISILGDDEAGKAMLEHSKQMNYDMSNSLIIEGGHTPTYMAVLDEHGEMVSAVVDMKIIDKFTTEFIDSKADIIRNAEYMILDSDRPDIVEYILKNFSGNTKFILDPVSAAKAKEIKHLIKYFHTIKPNRYEAEIMCGMKIKNDEDLRKAGRYFIDLGIENVFITLDEDGIYYNNGVEEGKIKANDVKVVNVTGAGDSFVAGIAYGYANKCSLIDTLKFAISMSTITISTEETIHPEMGTDLVKSYVNNINWSEVKFDK
ncbi:kinase [Romboutsia sp. CE17]|uniref:carbohydrate kinase family protein n=1 Tax=Romboutsia sp. CE17 TaxID=2724150 RepID=UPI001442B545|nr:carbohydrate kinase family protein [Romboutsia sp. CE17]QJA09754.1 kinase [Romboutsia sp. CE17]